MTLTSIVFFEPIWIAVGLILSICYIYCIVWKKNVLHFQFEELLEVDRFQCSVYWLRNIVTISIIVLSCLLLARPQLPMSDDNTQKKGIDIILAMDISYSMEATDFQPNRLVAAKEVLGGFVEELETDRVGLSVFAGKPFVSVPLTFDYEIVEEVIERTTVDTINQNVRGLQGTAIGDAMLSSLTLLEKGRMEFEKNEKREQVIVLLTDGEANTGIDPVVVAELAKEQDIKIYTVGIGSLEGGIISFQSAFGLRKQQIPGVDETTLKKIASITNGKYRRATDDKTFRAIFDEIAQLEKTNIEVENVRIRKETLLWLVWIILVLVVAVIVEHFLFPVYDDLQLSDSFIYSISVIYIRKVLLLGSLVCVLIAIWNPSWLGGEEERNGVGYEFMVMLDVSTSMEVQDILYGNQYISRLTTAKTLIERLVQNYPTSKLGLGVFAGESVGLLPITGDVATVLSFLGSANANNVTKQGTNINQALHTAIARYQGVGDSQKTILLITDGGDSDTNIETSIQNDLQEQGILLSTILIGTKEGGPIPLGKDSFGAQIYKQYDGKRVVSKVKPSLLKKKIDKVGGSMYTIEALDDIGSVLKGLGKTSIQTISGLSGRKATIGVRMGVGASLFLFLLYLWSYSRFTHLLVTRKQG